MANINGIESVSRGIVKYTSRDYESLLRDFWDMVPSLTELWKPEADADPGVVLSKFVASAADMLGVSLDIQANEMYAPSVQQRKNAEKLFGLIGYNLGWYTAARTEVTFTNATESPITLDFGFNGSNFSTVTAYTDITNQSRVITYNILPMTGKYGSSESRSKRETVAKDSDVFANQDKVTLQSGESATRVAIEGELRSISVPVSEVKANKYVITLPSQHVDTTAVWMRAKSSLADDDFLGTQWLQCDSVADFVTPEPRFAVSYDNYSNAQIQVSNYLNQLENYESNYLVIYWIDCSGVIGCVGEDVFENFALAKPSASELSTSDIVISNLSNTVELPHSNVITGKSPETAKEAYFNSRNYINTWDSLVTLPDYTRFLNREPGVDCGIVIDCQKALEINLAIYHDPNLTDSQKSKMYITNRDFPEGDAIFDWKAVLEEGFDPSDNQRFVFATNFKRYTAMCFAIHNDFKDSAYGRSQTRKEMYKNQTREEVGYLGYKPPAQFISDVIRDYMPLKSMTVELAFGYARVFTFFVTGQIFTKRPVTQEVGNTLINVVREALSIYFSPAARHFGEKPTVMEIVNVIQSADSNIAYFDAGTPTSPVINWSNCDIERFNPISFARYVDLGDNANNLIISPDCIIR